MSLSVALDDYISALQSLPREEALRLLRELPPTPTGLSDQLDAATAEAQQNAVILVGDDACVGVAPGWVRLGASDAMVMWLEGDSRTCMHDPQPLRPAPVYACAWRPSLIVCADCTHLLRASNAIADATCDGCGSVCTDVGAGDGIHQSTFVFGPLTFLMGLCGRCLADTKPGETP